ncbi:MAG: hypothetical protein Q7J54_02930 [Candidatus Woesearchaeota archaeon]|nr:hypothetical protein [Candidatus Woesearchaeota archaeon]
MITLTERVASMHYGYDSPELRSLSLNSRIFPRTYKLNIDDLQKPYNYLPKANNPYEEPKKTEIADKIQKLYDFYNPEIYNRTNATVLNIINQQIFDNSRKRVKWSKTLGFLESQIKKYADSLDSVSLNYLINLHNMLSPHVNKCIEKYKKIEDAKSARDYLTKSASELEKRHKVVSYNEAHDDLEEKMEVTTATQKSFVCNRTGGSPKSAFFKTLGAITLAAYVAVSSLGWWNSAKEAKASKNKAEGLETALAGVLQEYDGVKNKVSQMEIKVNEIESRNSQLQLELDDLDKKYNEEKAAQEQAIEQKAPETLPKIPTQSSVPNTNFTFGHKTEDALKLYSPKERYALERIATAMDYKDIGKAVRSMKLAEKAVKKSGNPNLISFYDGYLEILLQSEQEVREQKPMSDDEKYGLLFRTIQPIQTSETKPLETMVTEAKQEEKCKKTFLQKVGDAIWKYTPLSLVSIPEWKRHPIIQTIKAGTVVGGYYLLEGAGDGVAAGVASGGGEGVGGGGGGKVISTVLNLN